MTTTAAELHLWIIAEVFGFGILRHHQRQLSDARVYNVYKYKLFAMMKLAAISDHRKTQPTELTTAHAKRPARKLMVWIERVRGKVCVRVNCVQMRRDCSESHCTPCAWARFHKVRNMLIAHGCESALRIIQRREYYPADV